MQRYNDEVNNFFGTLQQNLIETVQEMKQGKWIIIFNPDTDELTWYNPRLQSSEDSLQVAIDEYLAISLNRQTAEIENFNVQDFNSVYVGLNPELKPFAESIKKREKSTVRIDHDPEIKSKIAEIFLGKFLYNFTDALKAVV